MKLISLAALSFLAITVSAYPGPGTPPQGAGVPSAQPQGAQQPRDDRGQGLWQGLMDPIYNPQQPQNAGARDTEQPQDAGAQDNSNLMLIMAVFYRNLTNAYYRIN
ncbi:hypothetical protein BASA84_001053 [Batrachochytrium salamandrivorans]|nr:hypothetical protein BASA84_001053 [Batrachochytrium salamandrivorans]